MKKLLTWTIMALVLIGVFAVSSIAGVKNINPGQLQPQHSGSSYSQTNSRISSGDTQPASFFTEVKLPRGKVVKNLTYYHESKGATFTRVTLYRTKFGERDQVIAECFEDTNTGDLTIISTAVDDEIDYAKILGSYSYWVSVYSSNENSGVRGISITYK